MNIPCPIHDNCPGTDSPFANLSAELPDVDNFNGFFTGAAWLYPPLGSNWSALSCLGLCQSSVSQVDADLCAVFNTLECLFDDWGPPGILPNGGPSSGPPLIYPPSTPLGIFRNSVQACTVVCPDGLPFTFTVAAGRFPGINQISADRAAYSFACRLAYQNLLCLSSLSSKACVNSPYSSSISPSRAGTYLFAVIAGTLPPGLVLSPGPAPFGVISGTPTSTGNYVFTVAVRDGIGNFMVKTYQINVMGFTNASPLPDATVGSNYTTVLAGTGGIAPYTFSLQLGTLPDGLTLNSDGSFSGQPTTAADYTFTIGIADAAVNFCTKEFKVTVTTGCPTLLTSTLIGGATGAWGWAVMCNTTDLINPNKVFAARQTEKNLAVMNADTEVFITSIAGAPNFIGVLGAAYSPVVEKLYVSSVDGGFVNNYIQIVNAKTNALLGTFTDAPGTTYGFRHLHYEPATDLIYGTGDNGALAGTDCIVINANTDTLSRFVCTVAPGIGTELATDVAYCPSNNRIYAATYAAAAGTAFLRGYNATTHALEYSANLFPDIPVALIWVASVSRLYIYTQRFGTNQGKIQIFNPALGTLATPINLGIERASEVMGVWTNKNLLVVPVDSGLVYFIQVTNNTVLCSLPATFLTNYNIGFLTGKMFLCPGGDTFIDTYH